MAETQFAHLLQNLSEQISILGFSAIIPIFSGEDKSKFEDWIKAIDRCATVGHLSENQKCLIAYKFSSGIVYNYIHRLLQQDPTCPWQTLKEELTSRFGELNDALYHRSVIQNIRQKAGENVQNFSERIAELAQKAYRGLDGTVVNTLLTGHFTNGLLDKSIRKKLFSSNPTTFQQATELAVKEQNVQLRCMLNAQANATPLTPTPSQQPFLSPAACAPPPTCSHTCYNDHRQYEPMEIDNVRRKNMHSSCHDRHPRSDYHYRPRPVNSINNPQTHPPRSQRAPIQCWSCHQYGHVRAKCPQFTRRPQPQTYYPRNTYRNSSFNRYPKNM